MRIRHIAIALLLSASLATAPRPVAAAESYDTCAHYIDTLPAVTGQQGVWCLRKDLATSEAESNAITIAANNVTIDCNGFKLDGSAAGNGSHEIGIHAEDRQNVTIRHCDIRGFFEGVYLSGGSGHLVEDNRFDSNRYTGIDITGDSRTLIQRNRVFNTGGTTDGADYVSGINASGDIVDNVIDGVFSDGGSSLIFGIFGYGARISGNRVGGLKFSGVGVTATGIRAADGADHVVAGNHVTAAQASIHGVGIRGGSDHTSLCAGNTVANFEAAFADCEFVANTVNASH
jgi:parallel beta-helix repeat protein